MQIKAYLVKSQNCEGQAAGSRYYEKPLAERAAASLKREGHKSVKIMLRTYKGH